MRTTIAWLQRQIKDLEIQGLALASVVIVGAFLTGFALQYAVRYMTDYWRQPAPPVAVTVIKAHPVLISAPMLIREGRIQVEPMDGLVISPQGIDPLAPWPETALEPPPAAEPVTPPLPTSQPRKPARDKPRHSKQRAPYISGKIQQPQWATGV